MKIYYVVEATIHGEFIDKVNQYIKDGYELVGGVFITVWPNGGYRSYNQAVVKIIETQKIETSTY